MPLRIFPSSRRKECWTPPPLQRLSLQKPKNTAFLHSLPTFQPIPYSPHAINRSYFPPILPPPNHSRTAWPITAIPAHPGRTFCQKDRTLPVGREPCGRSLLTVLSFSTGQRCPRVEGGPRCRPAARCGSWSRRRRWGESPLWSSPRRIAAGGLIFPLPNCPQAGSWMRTPLTS